MAELKCPNCGSDVESTDSVCKFCGEVLNPMQVPYVEQEVVNEPTTDSTVKSDKDKLVAGLLGIFLGGLGIHKFYLGYSKEGVIMLVIWLVGWLTLGLGTTIIGIIGLVEGIIYLTKSDQEFYDTYVAGQKGWF